MNDSFFLKLRNLLYNFFHYIFIITFIAVLLIVFSFKGTINDKVIMIFSTIISLFFILGLYKKIVKSNINDKFFSYKFLILTFFCFICIQIFLGMQLRVKPSWDFGSVYNEAVYLTKSDIWSISNESYFLMYPNNQFYLLILTSIYKFLSFFGIAHYVVFGVLFNAIFVDVSLLIFYFCLKRIWNKKVAFFGLILSFICCAYTTYLPIFYTDTFPLPLTNIMLLLYIIVLKEKNLKKIFLYLVFLSISCMFAFQLKATAIIVLVAIILHMIFLLNIKKSFIFTIIICFTFICSLKIYTYSFEKSNILDMTQYDRYNFPYTHWLMMGLKTPGGYNEEDYLYTKSFVTREEKLVANMEVIEKRISNMEIDDFINHIKHKINFTWYDGTYFSSVLLSRKPLTNNFIRDIVSVNGNYYPVFKSICDGIHFSIIIFMVFSGIKGLLIMKRSNQMDFISCVRLSVFGLFIFLLIWETKSKYLVNFLPLIYLVSIDGIQFLFSLITDKSIALKNSKNY